ncbi:hypothetical protein [Albimonas pacifica]|uniref:Uncharacterized protein n=1 Tax=Albimonas pacifica TaxID=1114924 RepID=A0A1I3PWI2_9RHOB|nr:hypothetical protein [Albimonas pacifica]SFJ25286.1 hypothetical protein SAMN05216258_12116 [Albimonas pacifica]
MKRKPAPDWSDFDSLDGELSDTMALAANAHWASFAVAAALIDKGLIEKEALLKITEALIGLARSYEEPDAVNVDIALLSLEQFRGCLEVYDLKPGAVLPELELCETAAFLEQMVRRRNRPPEPEEDQD